MIGATRRWFRRNRKGLAIGAGIIGAGYLAGQYVLSKITEARERMSSDRIAREKYVTFGFTLVFWRNEMDKISIRSRARLW
jgi:hypothetical protein